jgi:zinc finger SWIM domain-containing protein 3
LSVDATALYGKWKWQLVIACCVDGHSWLYPVAYAVFDSETSENWNWFMDRLKSHITLAKTSVAKPKFSHTEKAKRT